jgi:hypothetical protein
VRNLLAHAILLGLALLGPLAQAEIYRWIDEHGTTHFSATPPTPAQRGETERLSVPGSGPGASTQRAPYGTWNGIVNGTPYELAFTTNGFTETNRRRRNEVMMGQWTLQGPALTLTHTHGFDSARVGQKENFVILSLDPHKLVLRDAQERDRVFYGRAPALHDGPMVRRLRGTWQSVPATKELHLGDGDFRIRLSAGGGDIEGHWRLADPYLSLFFILDRPASGTADRTGETIPYYIVQLTDELLVLRDPSGREARWVKRRGR